MRTIAAGVTPAGRARHLVRTWASEQPGVYLPFARRKYSLSPRVIGRGTELVIDGYTRSATTFAVYAFQLAQDRPVQLAHHLHAPAQLLAAARRRVPALLLLREPQGAVLSQLVREPDVALRDALLAYARFYDCLLPHRASFVVGRFEQVTGDFASVVRRLNERFGTAFAEFSPTETNLAECNDLIKLRPTLAPELLGFESGLVSVDQLREWRRGYSPPAAGSGIAADAWVPSSDRDRQKAALLEQWADPALRKLRDRAQRAYDTLAEVPASA